MIVNYANSNTITLKNPMSWNADKHENLSENYFLILILIVKFNIHAYRNIGSIASSVNL